MLIVMKFGGTSVGSAERIAQAAQLAVASAEQGHQVVVVTSAMSKVTDTLIGAARQASGGHWDPSVRQQLFDRHKAVADAVAGGDKTRHAGVLEALGQRLDRFFRCLPHALLPPSVKSQRVHEIRAHERAFQIVKCGRLADIIHCEFVLFYLHLIHE